MPAPPLLEHPPCGLICLTKCFAVFGGHELERRRIGSDPIAAVTWRACLDKQRVEACLDPMAMLGSVGDYVLTGLHGLALERDRHPTTFLISTFSVFMSSALPLIIPTRRWQAADLVVDSA
jgi:hypothetical protein